MKNAKEAFIFSIRMHISELTGLRAYSLGDLLKHLKAVSGSCIYHHTHKFLLQHISVSPEPPNDFAYWISEILGQEELGEKLASIDIIQFHTIRSLREKIVGIIEDYLKDNPKALERTVYEGQEFHFMKSISFVFPTKYMVYNIRDFVKVLSVIDIQSIYFHIFEARLRLEKGDNDFSNWIDFSLGNKKLADEISRIDPYTRTLEGLRKDLIRIITKDMTSKNGKNR